MQSALLLLTYGESFDIIKYEGFKNWNITWYKIEFWLRNYLLLSFNCLLLEYNTRSFMVQPLTCSTHVNSNFHFRLNLKTFARVSLEWRQHFGGSNLGHLLKAAQLISSGASTILPCQRPPCENSKESWWPGVLLAQADMLYACTRSYVCVSDILISESHFVMQITEQLNFWAPV